MSRRNLFARFTDYNLTVAEAVSLVASCAPCEAAQQVAQSTGGSSFEVSDRAWSDFTQSDYTPEQWRAATLIHLDPESGQDPDVKTLHKLPVYEPEGALNRNGCHAAASVISGGRGGVDAPEDKIKAAAKRLVGLYRSQLDEDPPDSLLDAAGMSQSDAAVTGVFDTVTEGRVPWEGILTVEGRMTGDGRMIEAGALTWEALPLVLRSVTEDTGFHQGATRAGSIDTIERRDGGVIWGTGYLDLGTVAGRELARVMATRTDDDATMGVGVSVDLDDVSFEIRVAADLLQQESDLDEAMEEHDPPEQPTDEEGRVTVIAIDSGDEVMVTTSARIRAATTVDIPAFIEARLQLTSAPEQEALPLVAGGVPVDPPGVWFQNPGLREPTRLTITDDGRVYGHLATWGSCHRGHATNGRCITPPFSSTGYAEFMTGTTLTAEGDTITTGVITMSTAHAGLTLSAAAAKYHYENTGSVAADIRVGEDAHGIWFAGALRPDMTREKQRALRAAPLSGDWRAFGTKQEMVAALAVNMPGFPVPAPAGLVAGGMMTALVAAGTLPLDTPRDTLTDADMDLLRELATAERVRRQTERNQEAAAMARRIEAGSLAAAVHR